MGPSVNALLHAKQHLWENWGLEGFINPIYLIRLTLKQPLVVSHRLGTIGLTVTHTALKDFIHGNRFEIWTALRCLVWAVLKTHYTRHQQVKMRACTGEDVINRNIQSGQHMLLYHLYLFDKDVINSKVFWGKNSLDLFYQYARWQ